MDRTIIFPASAPIPRGHRVEVVEPADGDGALIIVTDLDAGIRYEHGNRSLFEVSTWIGRVLECTVTTVRGAVRTAILVDPVGPGAAESDAALRGADAAAEAAKAESDRWGGADRSPAEEEPRFW